MSFFKNMNFPRAVIVVSLLTSIVLAWLLVDGYSRRAEVRTEFARTPQDIRSIQELALRLDKLHSLAADNETRGALKDLPVYVRGHAQHERVKIGQVDTQPSVSQYSRDVEDVRVTVTPKKDRHYTRGQIGNYLYRLEAGSPRVKVTSLKLTLANKIRPGEISEDIWDFKAEITARQSKKAN